MTNQVDFRPELKKVTSKSNGNIEVLLVVSNASLKGKKDDLDDFLGKTVTVVIQPEVYSYSVPVDKETNRPSIEYIVNTDGTVDVKKEEQLSLDIDGKAPEIENKTFEVDKDTVDEFIKRATTLEYPSNISINPRDVLCRLDEGEKASTIAADYDMSEVTMINELEIARQHFVPFADAWAKNKDSIIFSKATEDHEDDLENADDENENADSDHISVDSDNEEAENETDSSESEDGEEDPY